MGWGPVADEPLPETVVLDGALRLRGQDLVHDHRSPDGSRVETFSVRQVTDMRLDERRGFNRNLALVPLALEALTLALFAFSGSFAVLVWGSVYSAATLALPFGFPTFRLRFTVDDRPVSVEVPGGRVAEVRAFIAAVDTARSETPPAAPDGPVPVPTARPYGT